MERRFLPLKRAALAVRAERPKEARAEGDAEPSRIQGYGAVFYDANDAGTEYWLWDDMVERIMPGAFDRAIEEDDVRSLFNHNPDLILGRNTAGTLELSIDRRGLWYVATPPQTNLVRDQVLEPIRRGEVTGSSFMFEVLDRSWRETEIDGKPVYVRELNQVRLFEVGPVTFPAYEASTAAARSRSASNAAAALYADARADLEAWLAERRRRATAQAAAARARSLEIEVD